MTPLRRRMIEDMRIRNLSPKTQRVYVEQVSRFARHFGQPPERLGQHEIRALQIHLVEERQLAASSILVAVAALRFVYTVTLKQPLIVEDDTPNQPAAEETSRCAEPGGGRPVTRRQRDASGFNVALGTGRSVSTGRDSMPAGERLARPAREDRALPMPPAKRRDGSSAIASPLPILTVMLPLPS